MAKGEDTDFQEEYPKESLEKKMESEKSKRKSTWQISSQVQNVFRLVTNC